MAWPMRSLADVCQIRPPKTEARLRVSETDLVSFVPMEDLGAGQKVFTSVQERHLGEVVGSYTYFADGDVLLAKITPCFENGKLGVATNLKNGLGFGSSEYVVFRPSAVIDREWLYYFLSRVVFRQEGAKQMRGAVGHKRVSKEFIETYLIPVPSLDEQKRIIAIIDEAFEEIDKVILNVKKSLENARELYKSYHDSVFTHTGMNWNEDKLGTIGGEVFTGPFGSILHKSDYIVGGTPLVNPAHIVEDKIAHDATKTVGAEALERLQSYRLNLNDIVVGRRGEIGRCAIVTADEEGWLCGTGCFFIRVFIENEASFLAHLLRSRSYRVSLEAAASGTTMLNLSNNSLSNLIVRIPSIDIQKEIVLKLDFLAYQTTLLLTLYQKKLMKLL